MLAITKEILNSIEQEGFRDAGTEIIITPRLKKVLSIALKEAPGFDRNVIGTDHMLLALLREGDGLAARVLKSFGITHELIRRKMEEAEHTPGE